MGKIEVIQVVFYDGTKYLIRTDKPDCHEKLKEITLEKNAVLEAMSSTERIKIVNKSMESIGGLSKRTLRTIDEELYSQIKMKG